MPRSRTKALLIPAFLGMLLGWPGAVSSQEQDVRPRLPDGADPASAQAYYDFATEVLDREPERAAELFRWAALLDPEWVEPLEGWRAAVLLREMRGLRLYLTRRERDAGGRLADSLRYEASLRNPLQFRPFEGEVVQAYVRSLVRALNPTGADLTELEYQVDVALREDPAQRARFAYSNYELPYSLELYQSAIQRADSLSRGGLLAERGHVLAVAGRYEEARVELDSALAAFRKVDEEQLIVFYESKALQLYSMGLLAELLDDPEQAWEEYSGAIEEDLSFHPAHEGLARLSLARGDTAAAVASYRLSADLAPHAPTVRMKLAGMLLLTGEVAGAEEQASAAVAANPYYAAPHLVLGALADREGKMADAVTHYERFLELAPRTERNRPTVQNRVAALKVTAGGG